MPRNVVGRALLRKRRISRRRLHMCNQSARQCCVRHRQHELASSVLVGCLLAHIAISPVLIFGVGPLLALAPAGAGWGLIIPFTGGTVVMIWYLRSLREIVRLNFRGVMSRWELFADILGSACPG